MLALGLVAEAMRVLPCPEAAAPVLMRLFCRVMLRLLRVEVTVTAKPCPPAGARLVVANHVSWIDILALGSLEPLCFLAKREVASWPAIAAFARRQGTIFHDRASRRTIPATNAALAACLAEGRSVLLFPEGTTHDGMRRGRFLTSHLACLRDRFRADPALIRCPVQTVALAYSDPAAAWIGDDSLVPHLWRLLKRPRMRCSLVFGTPMMVEWDYDRKVLGRRLALDVEASLAVRAAPVVPRSRRPGDGGGCGRVASDRATLTPPKPSLRAQCGNPFRCCRDGLPRRCARRTDGPGAAAISPRPIPAALLSAGGSRIAAAPSRSRSDRRSMSPKTILARLRVDPYILAIVSMVVLATILPAKGEAAHVMGLVTTLAIALLFFLYGARLSREAVIAGLTHWRLQLLVFLSTFLLFPVLGLGMSFLAKPWLGAEMALGLLFLSTLPSTVQSSIAFTSIARGNVAAALCSASVSNLVGVGRHAAAGGAAVQHARRFFGRGRHRHRAATVPALRARAVGAAVHRRLDRPGTRR